MKNKLILLALAILCYGHIQAAERAKNWFANRWNSMKSYIPSRVREYTPYQQGSFKTYPPENVASRLASMKYLYGSDVAKEQKQLISDYEEYLNNQYFRQIKKDIDYSQARRALLNSAPKQKCAVEAAYDLRAADYLNKQINKVYTKSNYISDWEKNLAPTIRQQEAEMLKPRTFYQYQHPDQYILNN